MVALLMNFYNFHHFSYFRKNNNQKNCFSFAILVYHHFKKYKIFYLLFNTTRAPLTPLYTLYIDGN